MDMKQQLIDDMGVDIEHGQGKVHTLLQEAIMRNTHASCFATPKPKRHRLPDEEALRKVCPPAPKKLRSSSCLSVSCRRSTEHVAFFVPSDLHGLPECIRTLFHN